MIANEITPRIAARTALYGYALEIIGTAKRASENSGMQNAASYAKAIPRLAGNDHALAIQIDYILANLHTWRGERARYVKAALKLIRKILEQATT